jgi:hypothetical protein
MKRIKLPNLSAKPGTYILALCLILLIVGGIVADYLDQTPILFDKAGWMNRPSPDYTTRYRMIDDLTERNNLIGMSRREITGLLSQPDYFSDTDKKKMHYGLRKEYDGIIPVMSDDLIIVCDESGFVSEFMINHWESSAR